MSSEHARPASLRLSDDERRQRDELGFVVREAAFSRDEIARMTEACEELVADLVHDRRARRFAVGSYVFDLDPAHDVMIKWEGESDVVHGIEPFAHLSEPLERWAYDPRFIEPMKDFVGDESPTLFTEKLNLKRPHHGGANPLHQDFPYWTDSARDAMRVATAMLLLDDASVANGCLHVVPGSHRSGVWKGRSDGDAFAKNEIDPGAYPGVALEPVEVAAGSIVMFGPYLVHQSAPNRSEKERRALLYSYQPAGHPHMVDGVRRMRRRPERV